MADEQTQKPVHNFYIELFGCATPSKPDPTDKQIKESKKKFLKTLELEHAAGN